MCKDNHAYFFSKTKKKCISTAVGADRVRWGTEIVLVHPGQHWFPIQSSVDFIESAYDNVSWSAQATSRQWIPGRHYHMLFTFADALVKLSLENTRRAEGHVCTFL